MKTFTAVLLMLTLSAPVVAAESDPLAWPSHKEVADIISTLLVSGQLGANVIDNWKSDDPKQAFKCQALRTGIAIGATELLKRVISRWRPDFSDDMSFPSEHTAIAVANYGWKAAFSIPIAAGTGYLRGAASKHYLSDIAAGAGIGYLASKVCKEN